MKYFPETDTAHVEFAGKPAHETKEINQNILVDLDEAGNLVSMTV